MSWSVHLNIRILITLFSLFLKGVRKKKTEQTWANGNIQDERAILASPCTQNNAPTKEIYISPRPKPLKRYALFLFLVSAPGFCQSNTGELRLTVNDPSGRAVRTEVQLVSDANQYRSTFTTDAQGSVDARRLPYGCLLYTSTASKAFPWMVSMPFD